MAFFDFRLLKVHLNSKIDMIENKNENKIKTKNERIIQQSQITDGLIPMSFKYSFIFVSFSFIIVDTVSKNVTKNASDIKFGIKIKICF